MKNLTIIILLMYVCGFSSTAQTQLTIIPSPQEGVDAGISPEWPDSTVTNSLYLHVSTKVLTASYVQCALLKFDLSGIPINAVLDSARLNLTLFPHPFFFSYFDSFIISRVTSPWNNKTVTWNSKPSTEASVFKRATYIGNNYNYSLDLLDQFNYFIQHPDSNFGIELALYRSDPTQINSLTFRSSQAFQNQRPQMNLHFQGNPAIMRITAPIASDSLFRLLPASIRWQSTNVNKIRLEYTPDGINWVRIKDSVTASLGEYMWVVPVNVDSFKIRVSDVTTSMNSFTTQYLKVIPTQMLHLKPGPLAGKDTKIEYRPHTNIQTNWPNNPILSQQYNHTLPGSYIIDYSSLIEFDLTGISSNVTILKAGLSLYACDLLTLSGYGFKIAVNTIPWTESGVASYQQHRDQSTSPIVNIFSLSAGESIIGLNVKDLVDKMRIGGNNGFWITPMINGGSQERFNFASSDHADSTKWPELVIHYIDSTGIPVKLLAFHGRLNNGQGLLNWTTASEKNSKNFVVERSEDGLNFMPIGSVDASVNSNTLKQYTYTDDHIPSHEVYYRLTIVDLDGSFDKSEIVHLSNETTNKNEFKVFPNPSTGRVFIKVHGDQTKIKVTNITGQIVYSQQVIEGTHELKLPEILENGIYFISTSAGEVKKIILCK